MSFTNDRDCACVEISKAFQGVRYPEKSKIAATTSGIDELEVFSHRNTWQNVLWSEIPDEIISNNYSALVFCDSLCYQWLVPAYMTFTLKHFEKDDFATSSTVYNVSCAVLFNAEGNLTNSLVQNHSYVAEEFLSSIKNQRSSLTMQQKESMRVFLLFSLIYGDASSDIRIVQHALQNDYCYL